MDTKADGKRTEACDLCRLEGAGLFLPGDSERRLILRDINWTVERGRHTVLIGRNGAGKTTLLRLLHGQLWTTQGTISWYDGREWSTSRITGLGLTSLVSPQMQETYQRNAWSISGLEMLLTGFDGTDLLYTSPEAERVAMAEAMAEELEATGLLRRNVRELSQGQLRLLLLGRALVRRPSLLLLDECTDGLDQRHREAFLRALEKAARTSTVIITTHRESMLPSFVRERLYVCEGRLLREPPQPEEGSAELMDVAGIRDHARSTGSAAGADDARTIPVPLVDVEDACVYLRGREVLHHVNWRMFRGENWLLQGANGSGKSTFLRLLAGDEQVAWPGSITFSLPEDDGTADIPFVNLRRRVRLVSDFSQALYEYDVTCLELVLSGFENTVGLYRVYGEEERALAMEQLRRVGLAHVAGSSIRSVSTGQLRRAFLARALMGAPLVLLLDEACTGLDERGRHDYLDVLERLVDEGINYVFVSHYEEDVPASVNRTARMRDGYLEC